MVHFCKLLRRRCALQTSSVLVRINRFSVKGYGGRKHNVLSEIDVLNRQMLKTGAMNEIG